MKNQIFTILFLLSSFFGFTQSESAFTKLEEAKTIEDYSTKNSLSQSELLYKIEKGWVIINDVKTTTEVVSVKTLVHKETGEGLTDELLKSDEFNILMYEISFDNTLAKVFILENGTQTLMVWSDKRIKTLCKRNEINKKENK